MSPGTGHSRARYRGPLGATRREHVHYACACGALHSVEVVVSVDSQSDPLLARRMRERLDTTWGLAEAGAAGPTGNRYGDPAGHTCIAVSGPSERAVTLRTGGSDRRSNMQAFSVRALEVFADGLRDE